MTTPEGPTPDLPENEQPNEQESSISSQDLTDIIAEAQTRELADATLQETSSYLDENGDNGHKKEGIVVKGMRTVMSSRIYKAIDFFMIAAASMPDLVADVLEQKTGMNREQIRMVLEMGIGGWIAADSAMEATVRDEGWKWRLFINAASIVAGAMEFFTSLKATFEPRILRLFRRLRRIGFTVKRQTKRLSNTVNRIVRRGAQLLGIGFLGLGGAEAASGLATTEGASQGIVFGGASCALWLWNKMANKDAAKTIAEVEMMLAKSIAEGLGDPSLVPSILADLRKSHENGSENGEGDSFDAMGQSIWKIHKRINPFLGTQALKTIMKEGDVEVIEGVATVGFFDVVGYTNMSDKFPPKEVLKAVNSLQNLLEQIVEEEQSKSVDKKQATFEWDKNIGDASMVFGNPDMVLRVLSAFAHRTKDFSVTMTDNEGQEVDWPVSVRVGMSYGPVLEGVIGNNTFKDATFSGPTVIKASRFESGAKQFGTNVAVDGSLIRQAGNEVGRRSRRIVCAAMKGFAHGTDVYTIDPERKSSDFLQPYNKGIALLLKGPEHWEKAKSSLEAAQVIHRNTYNEEDGPTQVALGWIDTLSREALAEKAEETLTQQREEVRSRMKEIPDALQASVQGIIDSSEEGSRAHQKPGIEFIPPNKEYEGFLRFTQK